MRKKLFIVLTAFCICAFAACGQSNTSEGESGEKKNKSSQESKETGESNEDPLSRIVSGESGMGDLDSLLSGDGSDDSGLGSLLSGEGSGEGLDQLYSDHLDESTKRQIIEEAKKEGADISFGADGSMTVVDKDGSVAKQNADGSWSYKDTDGAEGTLGGGWPDNKYTKMLPEPSFQILMVSTDESGFSAVFSGVTIEDARAYVEKLKSAGFTKEQQTEDQELMGMVIYFYSGQNSDGYLAEASFASGSFSLTLQEY